MRRLLSFLPIFAALISAATSADGGVPVEYQLPGKPGETFLVTVAIVDPKQPDGIVSQFISGATRTITAENKGKFTDEWDGLDDNFMPVPPGSYALRGIFSPAKQWPVDNEFHSVTPLFHSAASSWSPSPDDWKSPMPFGGDPVGSPLGDVAIGANGVAVFYYTYLENGLNNPMIDLKKPVGHDQFLRAFNSGGAGGGPCTATDGETVWSYAAEGGPKYVYRADGKPFGRAEGANRLNSYLPEGWVNAMAVWHEPQGQPVLYVAQGAKMISEKGPLHTKHLASKTEFVDKITFHDGNDGKVLGETSLPRPQGLAVVGRKLVALHAAAKDGTGGFVVSEAALTNGIPGAWQKLFAVPANINPGDLEVDSHGRIYLSDPNANHVYQLDLAGKVTRTYGKLDAQKPGTFDPLTFIQPNKLATWLAPDGEDHLLVVEMGGPNRVTEWTANGAFVRDFLTLQTNANDGYGIDPEHPEMVYIPGHKNWLTRFKLDYEKHTWTIDAVWPDVGPNANGLRGPKLDRIQFIRANGQMFLAGRRSCDIYRLDGDKWLLSAGILKHEKATKDEPNSVDLWHDTNGNGKIDADEKTNIQNPPRAMTYHGQRWLDDLSYIGPEQGGRDVWRLAPEGFDAHGNPIFKEFKKVLTDPILTAIAAKKADALHGGNELSDVYTSDWSSADGTLADGFVVQARGGKNFSANEAPQHKLTRYVPDGQGGYKMLWRTGRTALRSIAKPGEIYGAMRVQRSIGGLISVVDQSRCGILLYTEDGLYVDTLFPDGRKFNREVAGIYPQPGEFFAGDVVPNKVNGRIYIAMGKFTPILYEAEGWNLKGNPTQRLTSLPKSIAISSAQIAHPPEMALSIRGGAGSAKLAQFSPALGTVAMDGSMAGWETCEPVIFKGEVTDAAEPVDPKAKGKKPDLGHTVELRPLYRPDALLLRWHVRTGSAFEPKPLPPLERIFTHDQLSDTVSFYLQGDPQATPGKNGDGRPGDARFVFGIFKDAAGEIQPVGVGMYAAWSGPGAKPQTYRTPVGEATYAHVGAISGAKLGFAVDEDKRGFVLTAEIPRGALPLGKIALDEGLRTQVNFEATLGGHHKFWWANSDGSASSETYDEPTEARLYTGSWAPVVFTGFEKGLIVQNWYALGPFGGPGTEQFKWDPNGPMPGTNKQMKDVARDLLNKNVYPPDTLPIDFAAKYDGPETLGYWKKPGVVAWKQVGIRDLDTRFFAPEGGGAQVWYGSTWIKVPQATDLEFQFQEGPQSFNRWTLNDLPLKLAKSVPGELASKQHLVTTSQKLTLQPGWNRIGVRGFCVGYAPFRAGIILQGDSAKLWSLQLSGVPPK